MLCTDNGDRLLSQTFTHDGYEHRQERKREDVNANVFVPLVGRRLSAVKYDMLLHSRHNGRHRTRKVGYEI